MNLRAPLAIDERLKPRALLALAALLAVLAASQAWALINFQPLGLDYLPLWTAGRMAWTDPGHVYDFAAVTHAQGWLLPGLKWLRPYAYPPTALLVLAPFGLLPFWISLALWTGLGMASFLAASARLAGERRSLAVILALLSPSVVIAAVVGQMVLLVAGLAVFAVMWLPTRPRLAGLLLAVAAALKPQALLLAPVALIAGGAFEALAAAALAEVALVALSVLVFGFSRWGEWFASLGPFRQVIESVPRLLLGVITPYGLARELGLVGLPLTLWSIAFALIGVVIVWRVFARSADPARRLAALLGAGLLVTPYAMHYDGSLLVPAAVALAVSNLAAPGWILRLLALAAVCEVATPYVGALCVMAFLALTTLQISPRPAHAAMAAA